MSWTPIIEGVSEAARLILSADKTVIEVTYRSLQTAGSATLMASLIGVPLSVLIAMAEFRGKGTIKFLFNAMVGVPTVTLGLFLYTLFSRTGPLGSLGLLYTVEGMAIGQAVLLLPILVSFTASAIESKGNELRDLARTLGASEDQVSLGG